MPRRQPVRRGWAAASTVGAVSLRVAADTTPLLGQRTGIGTFVARLTDELDQRDDVDLVRYVVSMRAPIPEGVRRFPYPARVALASWARLGHPSGRRTLAGADVVHGTNYVTPPTGWPTVVSVHDVSFVTRPELANAGRAVVRARHPTRRRRRRVGAHDLRARRRAGRASARRPTG